MISELRLPRRDFPYSEAVTVSNAFSGGLTHHRVASSVAFHGSIAGTTSGVHKLDRSRLHTRKNQSVVPAPAYRPSVAPVCFRLTGPPSIGVTISYRTAQVARSIEKLFAAAPQWVAIIGLRKIAKTSLVLEAARRAWKNSEP